MIKKLLIFSSVLLLLTGCIQKEEPIERFQTEIVKTELTAPFSAPETELIAPFPTAGTSIKETVPITETTIEMLQTTVVKETSAVDNEEERTAISEAIEKTEIIPETEQAVSAPNVQNIENRDFSFFDDSLFIGDSVCSGLKLYSNLLDVQHVAARGNIGTWNINDYTFQYENSTNETDYMSIVEMYHPQKVLLWMGLNDIYMTSADKRNASLQNIADNIHAVWPETEIYAVSMTPINHNHKWFEKGAMDLIEENNKSLEQYCMDNDNMRYIDVFQCLLSPEEELDTDYDGGDGLHLSQKAYFVILNQIIESIQEE